jgi:hypothetical protein
MTYEKIFSIFVYVLQCECVCLCVQICVAYFACVGDDDNSYKT